MTTLLNKKIEVWPAIVLIPAALVAAGCTRATSAPGSARPPEVEVVPVEQREIPIYREWIGTLDGMVNAAIRAQVTGYLLTQNYSEGSFVRKGQLLFEITENCRKRMRLRPPADKTADKNLRLSP